MEQQFGANGIYAQNAVHQQQQGILQQQQAQPKKGMMLGALVWTNTVHSAPPFAPTIEMSCRTLATSTSRGAVSGGFSRENLAEWANRAWGNGNNSKDDESSHYIELLKGVVEQLEEATDKTG